MECPDPHCARERPGKKNWCPVKASVGRDEVWPLPGLVPRKRVVLGPIMQPPEPCRYRDLAEPIAFWIPRLWCLVVARHEFLVDRRHIDLGDLDQADGVVVRAGHHNPMAVDLTDCEASRDFSVD